MKFCLCLKLRSHIREFKFKKSIEQNYSVWKNELIYALLQVLLSNDGLAERSLIKTSHRQNSIFFHDPSTRNSVDLAVRTSNLQEV